MSNLTGSQLAERVLAGDPIPTTITLQAILDALKLIAQMIPIIDGIWPYVVRWWKQIFGTKQERAAVRAYKVLMEAKKIIEEREAAMASEQK